MTDEDLNVSVAQDIMGHYVEKIDGKWVCSRNTSLNMMRSQIPDYINDEGYFHLAVQKIKCMGIRIDQSDPYMLKLWNVNPEYLILEQPIETPYLSGRKNYLRAFVDAIAILRPY